VEDNASLIKEIDEEEIYQEIWGLEPYKALGIDGFSIHCFR